MGGSPATSQSSMHNSIASTLFSRNEHHVEDLQRIEKALADLAEATESERPQLEEQLTSTRAEIGASRASWSATSKASKTADSPPQLVCTAVSDSGNATESMLKRGDESLNPLTMQ